jgi:transposase InsO family protein
MCAAARLRETVPTNSYPNGSLPYGTNEHWFTGLPHARTVIEAWRREYNEERPKKSLGGLTPAQYAKQLASKAITMPDDSQALRY